MVGKLRSPWRHRRSDPDVRQASILVRMWCFFTSKPFLAHTLLLFCMNLACWCWGIDSTCLPLLDSRWWLFWQGPLHSQLSHTYLYTSRVLLHPQCPCHCQMSISGKHCEWINFLCVSVRSCMCLSTCCVHHTGWVGWLGGQLWSLFGVRLPVSVIHQGRYPAGAHMNTCIEANAFTSITSCGKCLLYIIYTVPTILTH